MKPYIFELEDLSPLRAYAAVADMEYSLLLDSADTNHPSSRYSYVLAKPVEMISTKNGKTTICSKTQKGTFTGDPFSLIQERLNYRIKTQETVEGLPPFQGGLAGFFGYDLVRGIETIPALAKDNEDMPDMAVGIYDQVYAYDHAQNRGWVITHCDNEAEARLKQKCFIRAITRAVETKEYQPRIIDWEANFDAHDYKNQIRKIIDYIEAGDVFQANMTQRFDADLEDRFDAFAHYLHLRKINPAPFASFMNLGDIQISSSSPERFLSVHDGEVKTQPIKGTRPHVEDSTLDKVLKHELMSSNKDRAENTMIVDLMRNDLSKVCEPKSVLVTDLCKVETFSSVHHLVSSITGTLKKEFSPLDLLKACFPGGSITGTPKIRAMEIIEELEPTRRGPYCGSMAYIGFDGAMDSSILIRTLLFEGDKKNRHVCFQVGGGIVADSDPDAEYAETFDKADAIFRSFEDGLIEEEDLDISINA